MKGNNAELSLPKVLIFGEPMVGKSCLIRALPGTENHEADNSTLLKLDTKYYSALANVVSSDSSGLSQKISDPEAIILVFDATREDSFNYVKSWVKTSRPEAELLLCVANKADKLLDNGEIHRPLWLQNTQDWCTEEHFEYIEAAAMRPEIDSTLILEGEQQGVRRVAAALEAHLWPGLRRKERHKQGQETTKNKGNGSKQEMSLDLARSQATYVQQSSDEAVERQLRSCKIPESSESDLEEFPKKYLERFDELMVEIAAIRSQRHNLSDGERRDAAAALTMGLMDEFGIEPESDSD